jgi:hypothetical protein
MRFSLFRKLFGRKNQSSSRQKLVQVRPRLEYLEDRTLLSVTWQVQSDFFGTRDGVSEPRSLRGLALTADNQNLYAGFIQGTSSSAIREVSAGVTSSLIGNDGGSPTNSYGANPPYTTGLLAKHTTFSQPKGLATDDRGNVYSTLNSGSNSLTQQWTIFNSSLSAQVASESSTNFTATSQLSSIATAKLGGHYFVYVGWKNGQIERWNVDDASAPVLDTTWGSAAHPGTISLKTIGVNAYLDGLTIDTNGDIYVAGGLQGTTAYGDSLIKITAAQAAIGNIASASHTDVKGGADGLGGYAAMDVALFNGQAYVTEYLGADSTIALFNTSDLSSAGILTPTNPTGPSGLSAAFNSDAGPDSGFSDIDISTDGKIYVAEQLYNYVAPADSYTPPGGVAMTGTRIYFDRVMVSSAQGVAPSITSTDHATFTAGTLGTFTVTATGAPLPSLSEVGALPNGVSFTDNHDGTATISGTPLVGTGGIYSISIKASNGVAPDAAQPFTLTVNEAAAVSGVSPSSGPATGGTSVTITGTGFFGTTAVHFGSASATFTVNSNSSITATAPPNIPGPVDVTVTNGTGTSAATTADVFTYLAVPTVTGIAPTSGLTSGGTSVTITGSGFTGATAVHFGAGNATSFHVVNDNTITAIAPAQGAGTVNVTVTTPSGTSAISGADHFTYVVAGTPFVTGLSANAGPTSGGALLYVQGSGFTGATSVTFGGTPATFFVLSDNMIQVFTPTHAVGVVDVLVTNAVGTSIPGPADQYTYQAAGAPSISSVSPNSGPAAGGNTVTIHGSNFNTTTAVKFGGTNALGFTVVNNTTITATAPAGVGTVDIVAFSPSGPSASSAADHYTFIAGPIVTGVSPANGPLIGGNTVTITGSNFTGAAAVKFGTVSASSFTVVNSNTITAVAPAGLLAGPVDVTVVTAGGTSGLSSLDQYTYASQVPSVTSLSPTSGPLAGGTVVTINGSGFTGATAVKFGANNATTFNVLSDSQIQAIAPAGAGTVDVKVTTPVGTSATVGADQYSYVVAPVPVVTGVSPNLGAPGGGTVVTITGSGFTGASAVTFGGVNALSFTVNSDGSITATSPPGVGTVDIRVTTVGGESNTGLSDHFTYVAAGAPTVSSLSATSGPSSGGTLLLITGSGFTGATSVTFGGTPATFFLVQSPTQIMALAPAHAAGTVNVIVTNAIGASVPNPNDQFTYF